MTPTCPHGDRVYREGTGKNGKPYKAWFCPAPKGASDQCQPEWAKNAPEGSQTHSGGSGEAVALLASIDSKLTILVELARENASKSVPF